MSDPTDLVERLRNGASNHTLTRELEHEAADAIEALIAPVEELIAAIHRHRSRLRGNGRDPQVWDYDLWWVADQIAGGTPRELAQRNEQR